MSLSGTMSRRWRVSPFSAHVCALDECVLVVGRESCTCLSHVLHGFVELAWPSPLVAVQVVTSRNAHRSGHPMLAARLAPPCLHRLRGSWTCPEGSRALTTATPAPALSPTVLSRRRDAAAPRRGPRLRPGKREIEVAVHIADRAQGGVAEHSSDAPVPVSNAYRGLMLVDSSRQTKIEDGASH